MSKRCKGSAGGREPGAGKLDFAKSELGLHDWFARFVGTSRVHFGSCKSTHTLFDPQELQEGLQHSLGPKKVRAEQRNIAELPMEEPEKPPATLKLYFGTLIILRAPQYRCGTVGESNNEGMKA